MNEYEVVLEIFNSCAGSSRPTTYFEVVEIDDPETYVKMKHAKYADQIQKTVLENGDLRFLLDLGSMKYQYTFTL